MLQTKSAKITASPGASGWVQVYSFSPSDPEKKRVRGELFAVIASRINQEGIEAVSFEREIAGRLRDEYFGGHQGKTFDVLRDVTQKIIDEFAQKEVEIVCCVFSDGIVYSSASKGGRVMICRDGALASILESVDGVITASGFPKAGDRIIAGTKSFFEKISATDLKSGLTEENPEVAAEVLAPNIYGGNEIGTAGGIIVKFEEGGSNDKVFSSPPPVNSPAPSVIRESAAAPILKVEKNFVAKLSKMASRFTHLIPKRNIYVREGMNDEAISHNRKLTLSVGVVLLAVLIVSVAFGIRQKHINDTKKQYQGLYAEAVGEIEQAINLANINPEESRQLFTLGESKLSQIKELKVKDSKVDDLEKKIEESRAAILGEYRISPELFFDLGLLSSGLKGDTISLSAGKVYVLDKSGSRVVSVEIDTKKSKVVAGPTIIDASEDIASYEDKVYLLLRDGVYQVGNAKTKVVDKTWSGGALIHAFAGNLYVLDKSGNTIYRYSGEAGGAFGSQQNWLSASTKADFEKAFSWSMNGAIYVLYPNSRVLKYSLGSPQGFSISGVSPDIGNIDALYADPDNQYVYLLDKAGKRIVVVDKNGKYKAQYISEQAGETTGLIVSEADKKIILLTGQKLLSIELKGI